jgi:hypothetical protein
MFHKDLDRVVALNGRGADAIGEEILHLVLDVASRTYRPKLWAQGYTDFQMTRGLLGISM